MVPFLARAPHEDFARVFRAVQTLVVRTLSVSNDEKVWVEQ